LDRGSKQKSSARRSWRSGKSPGTTTGNGSTGLLTPPCQTY
jgi:hypothetical protein